MNPIEVRFLEDQKTQVGIYSFSSREHIEDRVDIFKELEEMQEISCAFIRDVEHKNILIMLRPCRGEKLLPLIGLIDHQDEPGSGFACMVTERGIGKLKIPEELQFIKILDTKSKIVREMIQTFCLSEDLVDFPKAMGFGVDVLKCAEKNAIKNNEQMVLVYVGKPKAKEEAIKVGIKTQIGDHVFVFDMARILLNPNKIQFKKDAAIISTSREMTMETRYAMALTTITSAWLLASMSFYPDHDAPKVVALMLVFFWYYKMGQPSALEREHCRLLRSEIKKMIFFETSLKLKKS